MAEVLRLEGLTKLYKNGRGASDVSFTIESGGVFGLLGPNGSGKTTVMKALTGLVQGVGGTASVCGFDMGTQSEQALGKCGCLIESPALFGTLSGRDNLKMAARYYPEMPGTRIDEVLELCGMSRYASDKTKNYSLGMKQRLGIALALLSEPELLILDEPANGLDIEGQVAVREILRAVAGRGAAILLSSHLAHEIELSATTIGVMHEGRLLGYKPTQEITAAGQSVEEYYLGVVAESRKGAVS